MLKHLRQLTTDSVVYGLSGVVTRFITIFLVPLYTRAFTPADYGTMSLVRNSAVLIAMFTSLALDTAAHRFYWDAEDANGQKSTFACWTWCYLVISFLAAVVLIVTANNLSSWLVGNNRAAGSLRLAAASLPLNVLGLVYMNRLRMQRRPWGVATYAIITSITTIVLTAMFVLRFRWGVQGVFMAQFIVSLGTTVFLVACVRDWIHIRYFDFSRLKKMMRYALPMVPTLMALWAVDVIDRYFLNVYGSTSQVGIYEIGYSIAAVVALGTTAFQQAWFPFAMSIKDTSEARQVYANAWIAYVWVGSIVCVAATVFAPEALRLLTTKAYYGADSVVACLAFSYLVMGAGNIAGLGAAMVKKTVSIGFAVVCSAIANVGLNFWLVPAYGKDGAAWATLAASLIVPIYLFYRSQQFYRIPYRFDKPLVIVAFALVIIRIASTFSPGSLWLAIVGKLALISLFLPLLLVLRLLTLSHVRAMIQRATGWSAGFPAAEGR